MSETIKLKMDAYHDMCAEISNLKKELEHRERTITTLRDANKDFMIQAFRLQVQLREAKRHPRAFKSIRVV